MNNGNLPHGFKEPEQTHFKMPEPNEENVNTVYKSLPWQPCKNGSKQGVKALEASLERGKELIK